MPSTDRLSTGQPSSAGGARPAGKRSSPIGEARRRGDTRARIVEMAAALFASRGYMGTSIAAIEEAAGLTPGSGGLYRHFPSKEALLLAIMEGYRERLVLVRATLAIDAEAEADGGARAAIRRDPSRDLGRILAALVVFLSGEQAILHIGGDISGLPVSAREAIGAAWDEAYGIFSDLFTRYGFGEDRARALGVSALGSLAHYVSHRRRLRHAPLGVDIDPYVEEWSAHWSAFLASAVEEAGLAGQAGPPARGRSDALHEGRRSRHANPPGLLIRSVLLVVAVISMGGVLASCGRSAATHAHNASGTVAASQPQSVVYGIIPPQLPPSSKLPSITRQVSRLAGGKPFLVHLYTNWSQYPATLPALDSEIAAYTSRG
ncbi:MAG: TetR/AcrR family transcriptional regulator, partial [Actinobacteria bacterium]|nr:TetR/AcrR family transcriptional regulator [Actinomycetota bacterium]